MTTSANWLSLTAVATVLVIVAPRCVVATEVVVSSLSPPSAAQIDFKRDIRPILESSCLRCHGPNKPKSRFRLDNRKSALRGGEQGADILPGNSAKSPLIHYVARLVEDMEMPPEGKGDPLTAEQISLLRAWIDRGAAWDHSAPTSQLELSISPVIGGTIVHGDERKCRELNWQKEGVNGGAQQFDLFRQFDSDTSLEISGHALRDDYKLTLSLNRTDVGFIRSGWDQYRKYFDDTGGYYPTFAKPSPSLGEDLHLDLGKAWFDFGLTLPDWPRIVVGYEYDYRRGNEATAEWGAQESASGTTRNVLPASQSINEGVDIIKLDVGGEIKGVSVEERFRGEFYQLNTSSTNVANGPSPMNVNEGTTYFQGANTIRLERKFSDWFYGSAGYLYSKLNADSSFNLDSVAALQQTTIPQTTLERESHVGNLNGLLGPFDGLVISTGVQAEWIQQHGFGAGEFDQETPPPVVDTFVPFTVASSYDKTSVNENAAIRYSKIPFTSLFAEARLEQECIAQYDQFASSEDILNKAVFLQHTSFTGQSTDLRFGFNTSPWRSISFSSHYRRYEDESQYDSEPLVQPISTAYPTFIRSRRVLTDEVEARIAWRSSSQIKTSLSYHYHSTEDDLNTLAYVSFGNVISPGGELVGGRDHSHQIALNATMTPVSRLFFSTTLSYETSRMLSTAGGSQAVVPYQGDIYTFVADSTYVLNQGTDLSAGYVFSSANYAQNDFAVGLPLGIRYQRHSVHLGLAHVFGKSVSAKLLYRFDHYHEPSSAEANNFQANSVFGILNFRFH